MLVMLTLQIVFGEIVPGKFLLKLYRNRENVFYFLTNF